MQFLLRLTARQCTTNWYRQFVREEALQIFTRLDRRLNIGRPLLLAFGVSDQDRFVERHVSKMILVNILKVIPP